MPPRYSEFELIARLFAPLARGEAGAYGLTDDAATIAPPKGVELAVTADLVTAGVHFHHSDPAGAVARKALRVNLSDLAAKGAKAHSYLLSLALPRKTDTRWLAAFARGLKRDQREFGVTLLGGDTTATQGPLTVAITAFGFVPKGKMLRRAGAKPGDLVFVSGAIGDAGAGLRLAKNANTARGVLVRRYRLPEPRLALGRALRGIASAALDVSDGLIADLGHIAEVSRVRIAVKAARVPLSKAYVRARGNEANAIAAAVTAGDDYEIAFTVPRARARQAERAAARAGTPIACIGRVERGRGVAFLDAQGREIALPRKGFVHF